MTSKKQTAAELAKNVNIGNNETPKVKTLTIQIHSTLD